MKKILLAVVMLACLVTMAWGDPKTNCTPTPPTPVPGCQEGQTEILVTYVSGGQELYCGCDYWWQPLGTGRKVLRVTCGDYRDFIEVNNTVRIRVKPETFLPAP